MAWSYQAYKARLSILYRDRARWLERCRDKYRLNPKTEKSNPVRSVIIGAYAAAENAVTESETPAAEKEFAGARRLAAVVSRAALKDFSTQNDIAPPGSARWLDGIADDLRG